MSPAGPSPVECTSSFSARCQTTRLLVVRHAVRWWPCCLIGNQLLENVAPKTRFAQKQGYPSSEHVYLNIPVHHVVKTLGNKIRRPPKLVSPQQVRHSAVRRPHSERAIALACYFLLLTKGRYGAYLRLEVDPLDRDEHFGEALRLGHVERPLLHQPLARLRVRRSLATHLVGDQTKHTRKKGWANPVRFKNSLVAAEKKRERNRVLHMFVRHTFQSYIYKHESKGLGFLELNGLQPSEHESNRWATQPRPAE